MRIVLPVALVMLAISSHAMTETTVDIIAVTVEIKIEGEKTSYLIGGSAHTLDEVAAALKAAGDSTSIAIKAPATTPYEPLFALLATAGKVGSPATFITEAGEKIELPSVQGTHDNPISVRIKMIEGKAAVSDGPLKAYEADEKRDLKTLFIIKPTKDVPYGELIKVVERIRKSGAQSIGFAPPPR